MTSLNRKILEQIEESEYDDNVKDFLRTILLFELRNMNDQHPLYSKDYDRAITEHIVPKNKTEEGK